MWKICVCGRGVHAHVCIVCMMYVGGGVYCMCVSGMFVYCMCECECGLFNTTFIKYSCNFFFFFFFPGALVWTLLLFLSEDSLVGSGASGCCIPYTD